MLNKSGKSSMTFKPVLTVANVGDTITFIPKSTDHIPQSVFLPKEAIPWIGKVGEKLTIKLTGDGIYIYECRNHSLMGMAGLIKVGNISNMEEAKTFLTIFNKKFIMNKDRLSNAFDKLTMK